MDNSNPQSAYPNVQQSTKTQPSVDIQNIDVLEFPNRSTFVATSTFDISPTHFRQEKEYINKTYDISAEEYQALFSAPVKTNKCNKSFYSQDDISLSPSTGKTPKKDKEAVDELSLILVECMDKINTRSKEVLLRKFYVELEKEERLERFIVERLRKSKVKAITELYENMLENEEEKGVVEKGDHHDAVTRCFHDISDESSNKLDRFKVKTFDIGGVVLNEDKK